MAFVEVLHDVETAPVDVEVYVPLLEARGACFPHPYLRIHLLYGAPGGIAYAFAVFLRGYEQYLQFSLIT